MSGETLRVPEAAAGTRLDRFLAGAVGSRARAQALIDAGLVRVDGLLVPKRHLVRAGEAVEIEELPVEAPAAADETAPFEVAYEDEHLLVVDKPAGVVVHPARGHWAGTLAQALEGRAAGGEDPWRAGIVHRLDRDTSGLLVVAKSNAVHRGLKRLLAERRLRREYSALVDGHPDPRCEFRDLEARPFDQQSHVSGHFGALVGLQVCAGAVQHLSKGLGNAVRVRTLQHLFDLAGGAAERVPFDGHRDLLPGGDVAAFQR